MEHLNQGPLAPVWMAANYEKKLTKQQFLNTNIVRSTSLLNRSDSDKITLRLSGQLLLGIVRIYSKKTKYLLDDVNDILFKLKNAFKLASGGVLLGGENSSQLHNQQRNVNLNNIILGDQITSHNLLFQEDLDLDDDDNAEAIKLKNSLLRRPRLQADEEIDNSIEYGRFDDFNVGMDLDFDLDFNLGSNDSDASIEVGREASAAPDPDTSLLDLNPKDSILQLEAPLETIDEQPNEPVTPPEEAPIRPRKKLVGITEDGVLKTTKRRLQVDSEQDVNNGISIDEFRQLQQLQLNANWRDESVTFSLSEAEKMQLIQELAEPAGLKRRKLWNINEELSKICNTISEKEKTVEPEVPEDTQNFDDFNFDLSLPELEPDSEEEIMENVQDFSQDETTIEADHAESTKQIADVLKTIVEPIDFTTVIEKDCANDRPLGGKKEGQVNMRKEASKCFFELLVLASRDCISINQEPGATITDIGKDITISTKEGLLTNFV